MRRIQRFVISMMILLSSCSYAGDSTVIPSAIMIPTVTYSPTIMLEPSPTPDVRFQNLLPETLGEVREKNVIREDHLEEDLAALLEKEKQVNLDPEEMEPFNTGISGREIQENKLPGIIPLDVSNKNSIVSLSYLENEEGRQIYVLGVALKRPGSENVGIMHFAVDLEASENYNSLWGLDQEYIDFTYNLVNTYQRLKDGKFNYFMIETILWRGYAEEGGPWDPLLSVVKGSWTDYSVDAGLLVSWQTLNPDTGEMVKLKSEDEREYLDRVERVIFPAVSVGVIY